MKSANIKKPKGSKWLQLFLYSREIKRKSKSRIRTKELRAQAYTVCTPEGDLAVLSTYTNPGFIDPLILKLVREGEKRRSDLLNAKNGVGKTDMVG